MNLDDGPPADPSQPKPRIGFYPDGRARMKISGYTAARHENRVPE